MTEQVVSEQQGIASRLALLARGIGLIMVSVVFATLPSGAKASETVLPITPPGSTDVDQATLPPFPGLYGGLAVLPLNANENTYDSSGHVLPRQEGLRLQIQDVVPALLYVYPFKLFGGSLATTFVQPIEHLYYKVGPLQSQSRYGLIDAFSDVAYWTKYVGLLGAHPGRAPIPYGLSVGVGMAMVLPTGGYSRSNAVNLGGNVWVADPNVSATYNAGRILPFGDNTQISARVFYGIPFENNATRYQSGQIFDVDYSLTQQFGRFRAGVAGYYQQQITADDPADHISLPDGNRYTYATLGPVLTYTFPSGMQLKAKYDYTLYRRNFVDEQILVLSFGTKF